MNPAHAQAQALYRAGDLAGAKALFEVALTENPDHSDLHHDFGALLRQLGDRRTADRHVRLSLALAPAAPLGWTTTGLLAGDAGAFGHARRAIDRARLIAPHDPISLLARADIADRDECPAYADRLRATLARRDLADRLRARLLHALGRLLDRIDEVDGAFGAISAAQAIRRRARPYDPAADSAFFASLTATCDRDWWSRPGSAAGADVRPVFIVGMPRSGTTLVEQMLSRHPDIDAGGESLALQTVLAAELPRRIDAEFPDCLAAAGPADWAWAADRYLALTADRRRGAAVVTDKLPANFLLVGPILKMFPDARILHMVRDPLDNGLSCFMTDFAHGQTYATDLGFIAHHFRLYRGLMAHWHGFGDPRLRAVPYERLVTDPETELRGALAHCGLDWHPDCLAFGQSGHASNTASWQRVRGALDPRRVGQWRRYGHRLGRLAGRLAGSGDPVSVLRRTLAWEPGLAPETLALARTEPPGGDAAGRIFARIAVLAGRDIGMLSAAAEAAGHAVAPATALNLLTAAARIAPALPAVHLNLAVAHGRVGEPANARNSLRRAIALSPSLPEGWSNLGNLVSATDLPAALSAHRRAIAVSPGDPGLHSNRGYAQRRAPGVPEPSRRSFRRALLLEPANRGFGMSLHKAEIDGRSEAVGLTLLAWLQAAHPLDAVIRYEHGCALRAAGRDAEAVSELRRAVLLEPQHSPWRHVLDAMTGHSGRTVSASYARELFNQYADSFDTHLIEHLHYRTPEILTEAIARLRPGTVSLGRVLDLGCGTGLMGAALRARFAVGHLTGVDISGAMLARLREKGGYDEAVEAEVHDFLERGEGQYDLIAAADVLVYLGALDAFMSAAGRALAPGGVIALSVEQGDGPRFELRRSGRYVHRRDYIEEVAAAAGLRLAQCDTVTLREEDGLPVNGLIAVLVPAPDPQASNS